MTPTPRLSCLRADQDSDMTSPCIFFALGGCKRGTSCYYTHESPFTNNPSLQDPELRGEAALFSPRPAPVVERPVGPLDPHTIRKPTCHFFLQGTCRNGNLCRFSHEGAIEHQAIPVVPNTAQPSRTSRDATTDDITTQVSKCLTYQMSLISNLTDKQHTQLEPGEPRSQRSRCIF